MEALLSTLLDWLRTGLAFGLIVGFIAFIHEFGHYFVAKLCGVRVDEFSLGIGKALWTRQIGETEYNLRVLPFIAYVRPAGMDPEEEYEEGDDPGERSFQAKGFWAKQAILLGGPVANFLGTMVLLMGLFYFQGLTPSVMYVSRPQAGSPAELAGIQPNDLIVQLDDWVCDDFSNSIQFIADRADKVIAVRVLRPTESPPDVENLESWTSHTYQVKASPAGKLGVAVQSFKMPGDTRYPGFGEAAQLATTKTLGFVVQLYQATIGVIFRSATQMKVPAEVSGPVKIVAVISETSKMGLEANLWMTAQLSVSIGVFNLVPFPALDGGRMLILIVTAVFGFFCRLAGRGDVAESDTARQVEEWVHVLGFFLLIGLLIAVTWKDIREVIWGPPKRPAATEAPKAPGGSAPAGAATTAPAAPPASP